MISGLLPLPWTGGTAGRAGIEAVRGIEPGALARRAQAEADAA